MKKLIVTIVALAYLLPAAQAQNWTTVTASNITDLNQTKLVAGQLCFLGTDQADNPISFGVGGGGQLLRRTYCSSVTNGAVTPFTVPNPATAVPTGIYYRVTVKDTSNGSEALRYTQVTFSGTSFNLDNYAPTNLGSFAPLSGTAVSGNLNVSGNLAVTGTITPATFGATTTGSIDSIIYVDGVQNPSLASVLSSLTANSVWIIVPCGTQTLTSVQNITKNSVHIIGGGMDCTVINLTSATSDFFNVTGTDFELGNATLTSSVPRTAGWAVDAGSNAHRGFVHDVKFVDTYGGVKVAGSGGSSATGWHVKRLYQSTSAGKHSCSVIQFGGGDGSATGDNIVEFAYSLGQLGIYDCPQTLLDSGVDTNKFSHYDLGYSAGNTSTQPVFKIQNTAAGSFAPRWVRIENTSLEAGQSALADVFNFSAGNDVTVENSYATGGNRGFFISGGNGITIHDTLIANNYNGGVVTSGALTQLHLLLQGNKFSVNSMAVSNTADDVQIAGGSTYFQIIGNHFDKAEFGAPQVSRWGINLLAGASDQFMIMGNNFNATNLGTGTVNDLTSVGANKYVQDLKTITFGQGSARLRMTVSTAHPNWQWACQENVNNACEITPSTVSNGSTFTTPVFQIDQTGNATISGIGATAPGRLNFIDPVGRITFIKSPDPGGGNGQVGTATAHIFELVTNGTIAQSISTSQVSSFVKTGTTVNCSSTVGTCTSAPAGSVTIAAAASTVTVSTSAVTANSQIFVQEDSSLGTRLGVTCNTTMGRAYLVTARTPSTSFVVTASTAPATNPACLSYHIVN